MALDPKILDDLSNRVSQLLPPAARSFGQDLEKNLRAAANAAFAKLDLVTREEFEIQSGVLQRTRERLVELEQRVAEMEREADTPSNDAPRESH
jgi:BMFP domain-containing protein YqiC